MQGLLLKSLLGLALLPLFPASCQRRPPQAPAPPPAPNDLQQGDRYFDAGDYPAAITAYLAYLRQNPASAERERALFRLGLSLALPANPKSDSAQAIAYWNELASSFPKSPLRPEAELLAQLEEQIQQLQLDIDQREQQKEALSQQLQQLQQSQQLQQVQQGELEQLQSDLKTREERIRQLSEELDKLKAIDMQRRPANPPLH